MLPERIFFILSACFCYLTSLQGHRIKRQLLGGDVGARTTNQPYIDTDEASGANILIQNNQLNVTSVPAVDMAFGPPDTTTAAPVVVTAAPKLIAAQPKSGLRTMQPTTTMRPTTTVPIPTTTYTGFLANSPYPFALPPPDIPYLGSKWNGPWGYPIGQYQGFRGTGQYINHYNYYPLSYFGSLMAPHKYGLSG